MASCAMPAVHPPAATAQSKIGSLQLIHDLLQKAMGTLTLHTAEVGFGKTDWKPSGWQDTKPPFTHRAFKPFSMLMYSTLQELHAVYNGISFHSAMVNLGDSVFTELTQFSISTGTSDYAIPKAVTSMNKNHSQAQNTYTTGAAQGKLTHSPPTTSSSAGDAHQAIWTGHGQKYCYGMSRTTLFLHLLFFKYPYFFQLFSNTRSFYTKNCIMFLISFHITKELPNLPKAYISKESSGFQKVRRKLSPSIDKTQEIWQFQSSEATEKKLQTEIWS